MHREVNAMSHKIETIIVSMMYNSNRIWCGIITTSGDRKRLSTGETDRSMKRFLLPENSSVRIYRVESCV